MDNALQATDKVMAVGSQVTRRQGQPADVDWRMHRKNDRWYVIDVMVEGISITG